MKDCETTKCQQCGFELDPWMTVCPECGCGDMDDLTAYDCPGGVL